MGWFRIRDRREHNFIINRVVWLRGGKKMLNKMGKNRVPVGATPAVRYASWADHRAEIHEAAEAMRARRLYARQLVA
jgi:hypothetical protein